MDVHLFTPESVAQLSPIVESVHEDGGWERPKVHYDYYTGDPLDEDLYQAGKQDELQAMADYGVTRRSPSPRQWAVSTCVASPSLT